MGNKSSNTQVVTRTGSILSPRSKKKVLNGYCCGKECSNLSEIKQMTVQKLINQWYLTDEHIQVLDIFLREYKFPQLLNIILKYSK